MTLGGLGGLEVGVIGEGLLNQGIERRRMKQGPPVSGNFGALGKALGFTAGHIGGGDGGRRRLGVVIGDCRWLGALKIGSHGAAGEA